MQASKTAGEVTGKLRDLHANGMGLNELEAEREPRSEVRGPGSERKTRRDVTESVATLP